MAEIHEQRIRESTVDTILAEDLVFEGEASFTKDLMIKGQFLGTIKSTGVLYIGESANVEANIEAKAVYVRGRLRGNIEASTRVELQGEAEVTGNITAPKIVMDTGCRFDGLSRMQPSQEKTE